MTGRGQVIVLWDPEHPPPPGPLLDAAALATTGWDWEYHGPETPVRPPTMVAGHRTSPDDLADRLERADVVVGVPTLWTLGYVASAGARFVAVVLGSTPDHDVIAGEIVVEGWPPPADWPSVLSDAVALDADHHRTIVASPEAEDVASDIRDLLEEIRSNYLPSAFRPAHDGGEETALA
ncbi:hypothetical protein [Actinospongicola halichondriae]|uniref:hypothetical protein n=1 Tax=Actinospongicola halichondriae TaxID=3236844 RepID=UPI003D3C54F2